MLGANGRGHWPDNTKQFGWSGPATIGIDKFLSASRYLGLAQLAPWECFDRIALRRQCSLSLDIPRDHFRLADDSFWMQN